MLPAALLAVLGFITSRKTPKNTTIFARDGLAIVALVWVLMSAFGALPFVISGEIPSFIDCFLRDRLRLYHHRRHHPARTWKP